MSMLSQPNARQDWHAYAQEHSQRDLEQSVLRPYSDNLLLRICPMTAPCSAMQRHAAPTVGTSNAQTCSVLM